MQNELWTTDFNYGAKIEFPDIILSHRCTECNDGCCLAEHFVSHLPCFILLYGTVYHFALHK